MDPLIQYKNVWKCYLIKKYQKHSQSLINVNLSYRKNQLPTVRISCCFHLDLGGKSGSKFVDGSFKELLFLRVGDEKEDPPNSTGIELIWQVATGS